MKTILSASTVSGSVVLATLALAFGACATQPASSSATTTPTPTTTAPATPAPEVVATPAPAPVVPVVAVPAPAPISTAPTPVAVMAAIDFDKQVKPFFSEYCATCHSGARPRGQVHVDTKAGLLAHITPGDPNNSELFTIFGGPHKSMPPRSSPQPTADDIVMIKQWITQGASITDSYPSGT